VKEVGRPDDIAFAVAGNVVFPDDREAIGIAEGQALEEQRVDDAEDGGVGTDADRERGDGNEREAWRARQ
jgi:hypothetical protein